MGVVTIDDHDESVVYDGTWLSYHSDEEYMNAASWTSTAGSTAIVVFTGTKITVFGTIGVLGENGTMDRSTSEYGLDNKTASNWYISSPTQQYQYQTRFFESETMPLTQHQLTIINTNGSLYLDYFEVTTPDGSSTISTSTPTSPSATSSNASSSSAPSAVIHQSKKSPTGAIIGATCSAIVLLCMLGFMYLRKRRSGFTSGFRSNELDAFPPPPINDWQMSQTPANASPGGIFPFNTSSRAGATIPLLASIFQKGQAVGTPATTSPNVYFQSSTNKAIFASDPPATPRYEGSSNISRLSLLPRTSNIQDPPPSYSIA